MKKDTEFDSDESMRPEYDFSSAERGSAYRPSMSKGYTIREEQTDGTVTIVDIRPENAIVLEPDVQAYFPDSESVNHALRTIITLFPKSRARKRETFGADLQSKRRASKSRGRST